MNINIGGTGGTPEPNPGTGHFLERTPTARAARQTFLKIFGAGTTMVILMVFTILPIYWAALYQTPRRNLEGWVVDFDGGLVGERVVQALTSNSTPGKITWSIRPADAFDRGIEELQERVKEHDTWVAIAISAGTTARLQSALLSPDASYNGSEALVAFGVEARNENVYRGLIRPTVDAVLTIASRRLAQAVSAQAVQVANVTNILAVSPQTIYEPIGYTIRNLVPFDQPVATAATFVGMLYSLIMGIFVTMIAFMAREITGLNRRLTVKSLVILRLSCCFVAYLVLSLFYTLLNLAFQLDFSRKFGRGGFVVFWMLTYLGMLAMCLALEAMLTLTGPPGIPFFVLLWLICNISVSLFPIELLPGVFRYGYAFPFYNISKGLRTIVFGTKNELGQVVGILLGWIALSCITMTIFQYLMHPARREARAGGTPPSPPLDDSQVHLKD